MLYLIFFTLKKLFQTEDSFAEQKKECEEKVKSLESIVRMIDLKSKNTSDHGNLFINNFIFSNLARKLVIYFDYMLFYAEK